MPVSVDLSLDQSVEGSVTITATLTPSVTSNYTADGSLLTFKIGNKQFTITVNGCPDIWAQHVQTYTVTDLAGGNYSLTATYGGNDYHLEGNGITPLNVALRNAWIEVVVQSVNYGQNATVVITTNSNGTVRFNMHGRNEVIEVQMDNGRGEFNLTLENYTTPGKHSVGVILEPNEYYGFATNQTSFIVYKNVTPISATPSTPIEVGDMLTVNVTVNENATGFVKITINGKDYFEKLDGGNATFEIFGIPFGKYRNIPVEYLGDDYFNETSTKISFDVNYKDYVVNTKVSNVKYGENVTIYTALPGDVTEDVIFVINGTAYPNIPVVNGVAELTLPNLDVGEYPVVVVYPGDKKYDYKVNITSFNVTATDDWTLNITVDAHTYGQDTIFNVALPQNVTGNVNLTIEGINYTVELTNGEGNLTLHNISGGIQTVVAKYDGDERYLPKTNSTVFLIEKAPSQVNLTHDGRNVIASVTDGATGNVTFNINGKTILKKSMPMERQFSSMH